MQHTNHDHCVAWPRFKYVDILQYIVNEKLYIFQQITYVKVENEARKRRKKSQVPRRLIWNEKNLNVLQMEMRQKHTKLMKKSKKWADVRSPQTTTTFGCSKISLVLPNDQPQLSNMSSKQRRHVDNKRAISPRRRANKIPWK